jgi:hypothetical protein
MKLLELWGQRIDMQGECVENRYYSLKRVQLIQFINKSDLYLNSSCINVLYCLVSQKTILII